MWRDNILTQLTNQPSSMQQTNQYFQEQILYRYFSNNAIFHGPYAVNDRENKMTNLVPDILLIFIDNPALNSAFICTTSVFLNKCYTGL
jgi:hypothetical protein